MFGILMTIALVVASGLFTTVYLWRWWRSRGASKEGLPL